MDMGARLVGIFALWGAAAVGLYAIATMAPRYAGWPEIIGYVALTGIPFWGFFFLALRYLVTWRN